MSEVSDSQATTSATATDLASYQQFALEQQAQNNAWSAQQAEKQMAFQERMSSSSHQREVADLKAAGLNPVLSANSGASVPNGAAADADKSAAGNVGAILQQVLQAQSAREVAAMYNAATINAASIAAGASMYSADMAYKNKEDHPGSLRAWLAQNVQQGNTNTLGDFVNNLLGDTRVGTWAKGMANAMGQGYYTLFSSMLKGIAAKNPNYAYSLMQKATYYINQNKMNYKKLPAKGTLWYQLMQFLGL